MHKAFRSGDAIYHDTTANWRSYVAAGAKRKLSTGRKSPAEKVLVCPLPALTHIDGGMML